MHRTVGNTFRAALPSDSDLDPVGILFFDFIPPSRHHTLRTPEIPGVRHGGIAFSHPAILPAGGGASSPGAPLRAGESVTGPSSSARPSLERPAARTSAAGTTR